MEQGTATSRGGPGWLQSMAGTEMGTVGGTMAWWHGVGRRQLAQDGQDMAVGVQLGGDHR